jgi:hypothetical protein
MIITEIKYDGQVLMTKEVSEEGDSKVTYTPQIGIGDALELARSLPIASKIRLRSEAPDLWHLVVDVFGCSARDYVSRADLMDRLEHLRNVPYNEMNQGDLAVWALAKRRGILKDVRPTLHPPEELATVLDEEVTYLSFLTEVKGREIEK